MSHPTFPISHLLFLFSKGTYEPYSGGSKGADAHAKLT